MLLNDDKISHISHLILDGVWQDDLVEYRDEARTLLTIKQSIIQFLKMEEEVEERVRRKISSQAREIIEGSREWEILFKKYYEEELRKKGL